MWEILPSLSGGSEAHESKVMEETKAKQRFYVKDVKYVGGYYGACSEAKMMKEMQKGPIMVVS